jgi:hypothetical protein
VRKFLLSLTTASATVGLLLTLAIWWPLLVLRGAVSDWWQPLQLVSVRICLVLLVAQLFAGAITAFRSGRTDGKWYALWYCSTLAVIFSTGFVFLHRFDGTLTLAEGESYRATPAIFSSISRGLRAEIPRVSFSLREDAFRPGQQSVPIVWEGREQLIGPPWRSLDSYRLRFLKEGMALLCTVKNREGTVLEEGYLKLDLNYPGDTDTFTFPYLPFEFVISKGPAKDFTVEVRRGKLSIAQGALTIGGTIRFQELDLTLREIRKTARLQITGFPGRTLLFVIGALWILLSLVGIGRFIARGNTSG